MKVDVPMKKNLKIILISVSLAACISFFLFNKTSDTAASSQPHLPLISLSQIIGHRSLDEERRGLLDALKSAGYIDGKTIKITYQNAQGNLATAAQIAKMQAGQSPDVMVGISTPSAQTLLSVATSHAIPLVFTAVTNPVDAKLVNDNVFGVSDALPLASQIAHMREFIPNLKTICVIYNAGELNSTHVVRALNIACEKENIVLIPAIAAKTSDVAAAAQSLAGRVDAIYVPNDNTAVSAMASIVQVASSAKLPLFASDMGSVENGALAARGYDRFQLGQKAGALVVRILRHEKIEKNIDNSHDLHVYVNEKTLKMLGMDLPKSLNKDVILIGTRK